MSGVIYFCEMKTQNCSGELPSGVKDSLQPIGVGCAEEELTLVHTDTRKHGYSQRYTLSHMLRHNYTQRHTHTKHMQAYTHTDTDTQAPMHTNTYTHTALHRHTTHTHYQQSLIITQQNSLRQCPNCVMVFSVD